MPDTLPTEPQTPNGLPHCLREVSDIAGLDAVMKLALEIGGSRYTIPSKFEGSKLEKIVGSEAAEKITGEMFGAEFNVPLANKHLVHWLRGRGWSQQKISIRLRLSRRNVQNILAGKTDPFPTENEAA